MTRYRIDLHRRSNVSIRIIDSQANKPIYVYFQGGIEVITDWHYNYVRDLLAYCPAVFLRAYDDPSTRTRCLDIRPLEEDT